MITDQYIEMCRKAGELQDGWDPKPGDRFLWDGDIRYYTRDTSIQDYYVYTTDKFGGTWVGTQTDFEKKRFVWIPYQEQIQDLLGGDTFLPGPGWNPNSSVWQEAENWDECWLMMYIKCGKRWNGHEYTDII